MDTRSSHPSRTRLLQDATASFLSSPFTSPSHSPSKPVYITERTVVVPTTDSLTLSDSERVSVGFTDTGHKSTTLGVLCRLTSSLCRRLTRKQTLTLVPMKAKRGRPAHAFPQSIHNSAALPVCLPVSMYVSLTM